MFRDRGKKRYIVNIVLSLVLSALFLNLLSVQSYAIGATDQARIIIRNFYVDEVSYKNLNVDTVEEMVESLNDPYSKYLSKEQYKELTNSIDREFSGIGVHIDIVPEGLKVLSVIEGTPSEAAGLKAGDIITSADGHSLAGLPVENAVMYIKGEEGTAVHLEVIRGGSYYTYDIARKKIELPTVEGRMLDNHTAYIKIMSFGTNTPFKFRQKLSELNKHYPANYIVDVRNNSGGYLKSALDLAGSFIGEEPAVVTKGRNGREYKYLARGDVEVIDKPVLFLINQYSASASEVLAAAVKDNTGAFLIGSTTYGKGTVQNMFPLSDGSVLKLTVQRFYSPLGKVIDKNGVSPDFEVNGIDPLLIAELLSGKSAEGFDKTGFTKIKIGNRDFEIELEKARKTEYWSAFKYIIEKALESDWDIYTGTSTGWVKEKEHSDFNYYMYYFPEYNNMNSLSKVPVNKQFTITFSHDISAESIKNTDIELADEFSGERVPLKFETIDNYSIKVVPNVPLKHGGRYYLIINSSIISEQGNKLKQGTLTRVSVKN